MLLKLRAGSTLTAPEQHQNSIGIEVSRFFDTSCEILRSTGKRIEQEAVKMKGYSVGNGYMGLVNGSYMLFESEEAYREYLED